MNEYLELFNQQLNRIEELASRLLRRKYESARDLWLIQIDLARHQIDIRKEIAKQKEKQKEINNKIVDTARRREEGWKETIQSFQAELKRADMYIHIYKHALVLAKQLGDALAWLFLKADERKITSLSINKPNPPIPTGLSLQAMLSVAESYADAGAGFPILNDLTNCLRVGDLTFVNILDENDEPLSVEVKASVVSIEGDIANLHVTAYAAAYSPKFVEATEKLRKIPVKVKEPLSDTGATAGITDEAAKKRARKPDERSVRQVERMGHAKSLLTAEHGKPIEKIGQSNLRMPLIPVKLMMKHSYFHWDVIREMAATAKKSGYAARGVDDAFFYVVTYTDSPTIYPWLDNVELPYAQQWAEDYKNSFPKCADTKKNHICFKSTWDYISGDVPLNVRPFLLYELPVDMRMDILWRRLTIIVSINIGKIVEALERNIPGLSARVPENEEELNNFFIPITYEKELPDGSIVSIHRGGNLNDIAASVAFEFMSLEGFVESVSQAIATMLEVVESKWKTDAAAG